MQCIHTIASSPSLYTVNSTMNRNTTRKNQETSTPSVVQIWHWTPRSKLGPSRL